MSNVEIHMSNVTVSFTHLLVEISATRKCLLVDFLGQIFDKYPSDQSKIFYVWNTSLTGQQWEKTLQKFLVQLVNLLVGSFLTSKCLLVAKK